MGKYRLVKELPGYPVGTEFEENIYSTFYWDDLVKKGFAEEVNELVSVNVFKDGDIAYVINANEGNVSIRSYDRTLSFEARNWLAFRTKEEAGKELLRMEGRALRFKWKPENWDRFFSVSPTWQVVPHSFLNWQSLDSGMWHIGNVHKTQAEAIAWKEKYFSVFFE